MTRNTGFARRLLLALDAAAYGKGDEQRQFAFQSGLVTAVETAAEAAGLHRERWITERSGDGELALLPADEPEPLLVEAFVRELDAALGRHNRDLVPEARLRLRVAIHYGTAVPADNGWVGQGVVTVSRLVDCRPVRDAITAAASANLAVILSSQTFEDVVRQGHVSLSEADFRKVAVRAKEYSAEAWLRVPGRDMRWLDVIEGGGTAPLADVPRGGGDNGPGSSRAITQHFHGDIGANGAVFGIDASTGKRVRGD